MADPLATMAPPDPTWNPANTVPPEAMVAAQDPAQNIPPTQQSVDVNTPPPSDQMALLSSPMTAPIPSETAPNNPDIERHLHEAGWRKILDKVGTILGGDQTIHVTKDTKGNVTITHDPSTGGEKWGRIAQAALGGAAQGLANSQGPGGPARAAAAGTAYGLQLPQQRQQEADQQASAEQKRQMNSAQIARLNQEVVRTAWDNEHLEPEYQQKQADWALGHAKTLQDMGAIPVAMDVTDPQKLVQMANGNPQAVAAHLGKNGEILYNEPNGKGGVNFYRLPGSVASQRTTEDLKWEEIHLDPKDPTKTISVPHVTLAGQDTNGDRLKAQMANHVANDKVLAQVAKANKEKNPNEAALAVQATSDPDPAKRKEANDALNLLNRKKGQAAGGAGAGGPEAEKVANIRNSGGTAAQAIAALPAVDQGIVRGIGEGRSAPYSRATKEGQRVMALVNSAYPDYDAARFPTYQAARIKFTSGTEGQGLAFIKTARSHLARMETNIPDNVSIPMGVGSLVNWSKNSAKQSTDPKLKAFADDIEAVSSEVARAYKGGIIGVEDHNRMSKLLNSSDSPEAIRGAIQEFRELLKGKLQSYRDQWNSSMPSGVVSPLSTLENLEKDERPGQPAAAAAGAPAAAASAAAASPVVEGEPNFAASAKQPLNPPGPDKIFGKGTKGLGWYPRKKGQ